MIRVDGAPNLYMMGGLPGAGKTDFATHASEQIGAIHLNSVSMRREMGMSLGPIGSVKRIKQDPVVFGAMDAAAQSALADGMSVFYDASHNLRWIREKGLRLAMGVGATASLVWIETPRDTAVARTLARQEGDMVGNLPDEAKNYVLEVPRLSEPHIVIDGLLPVEEQFALFKSAAMLAARG